MSTPTGNLYLQAYNKSAGKFVEIPENVGTISFSARTGVQTTNFSRTPNFSGFIFSNSIDVKNLEMMPINIGTYNRTGDSIYAINLGLFNTNNVTITGFNYSGFVCSNNFGYFNLGSNSTYAFNLGGSNNADSSHQTYNVGASNLVNESLYSFNLGILNSIYTGQHTYVLGYSNTLVEGTNVLILGNENVNIKNINYSNINGSNNSITSGDFIYLIGNENNFSDINNIINIGNQNNLNNSSFITLIGNQNDSITDSNYQLIVGDNNSSISSNLNKTIGDSNSSISGSSNNRTFGNLNFIGGTSNIIHGDSNGTYFDVYNSNICGYSNSLSGTSNSYVMGSNNNLDPQIINLLYQVELTGITGAGPTLFTGVTGYIMLGGYAGVPGSGGNYNFIFGNNNKTSLNDSVYTFGKNNSILNNNNSYIIGNENYAELSENSYVFGQGNSVSGFKNYVIGNNNTIRSGDYNSILIGISHEFTGEFKVASINIASLDSRIEVNPNEVKISSPSRPKYNDVEITMPQDLLGYSKQENAINISGYFQSTIFQDSKYNSLAAQIELQKFSYSGVAERYYVSGRNVQVVDEFGPVPDTFYVPESTKFFTGINPDSSKYIFTNDNYFNKIYWQAYTGTNSILGDYFYESNDKNLLLSQTYDTFDNKARAGSKWVIRKNNTDGCYYLNYNNTNINDPLPFTGWFATGFLGFSGTNPAPVFKISKGFSGIFDKKILNIGNFDKSEHFTAQVCYPSEDISVIYGTHSTPKFQPTWLIVDNFSSGIYYINKNYNETTTPQTGWSSTGFAGATGYSRNPDGTPAFRLFGRTGINLSMGSRSGILAANVPGVGDRIYIPYFY
jgi:hypothetical protein